MVIIDTKSDDELRAIYYAREFMFAVQQMRKSAKLEMGDAIEVFFEVDASASGAAKLSAAIEANKDMIAEGIRTVPVPASLRSHTVSRFARKSSLLMWMTSQNRAL